MDVRRDNRVLSLVNRAGLKGTLTQMLDQLQRCQKSLNEFLEVLLFYIMSTGWAKKLSYFVLQPLTLKILIRLAPNLAQSNVILLLTSC